MLDTSIAKRIKDARIGSSLSQLEISEKLRITDKTYRNYEKGKDITVGVLKEIAKITNTDFYYLLNGQENMNLPSSDVITINFYPEVYAAAGGGATNGNAVPSPMNFDKSFLENLGLTQFKNLEMIKVTGDSMEPFIQNGEFVFLERKVEAKYNDVVVANINGQVYIKRFEADPFYKWIKLKSENEFSGDILLETKEEMEALSIIGIVRAKVKPF
jgi:phage repressor protein C with HTH and peptisase S24 domain